MTRFATAILWLLFFACTLYGQELTIKGAGVRQVTVVESVPFTVEAPKDAPKGAAIFGHTWEYKRETITATARGNVLEITAAQKGTIVVFCKWWVVDFGAQKVEEKTAFVTFSVGDVGPGPKPPEPKPPEPNPDKPPFPAEQFTVLIVHETMDKLPPAQRAIITSVLVREYLTKKCPKLSDGQTAFRIWDWNTDPKDDLPIFQAAWAAKPAREKIPWLIISDGKTGFSGPLPGTISDTLTLLKKYGGE